MVAALAKRTLLASSSASLRSSAVRSGARLNINGLVYHRRKALGLTFFPMTAVSVVASPDALLSGLRWGLWSATAFAVLALMLVVVSMGSSSRRQPEI